jgi:hypothetical protein
MTSFLRFFKISCSLTLPLLVHYCIRVFAGAHLSHRRLLQRACATGAARRDRRRGHARRRQVRLPLCGRVHRRGVLGVGRALSGGQGLHVHGAWYAAVRGMSSAISTSQLVIAIKNHSLPPSTKNGVECFPRKYWKAAQPPHQCTRGPLILALPSARYPHQAPAPARSRRTRSTLRSLRRTPRWPRASAPRTRPPTRIRRCACWRRRSRRPRRRRQRHRHWHWQERVCCCLPRSLNFF